MTSLLQPPVPPECDLRGAPIPLAFFVQMAVAQFGMSAPEAEQMLRKIAQANGMLVEESGHA